MSIEAMSGGSGVRFMKEGKRKNVLRCLKDKGPLSHRQLLEHMPDATRQDNTDMCAQGLLEIVGILRGKHRPGFIYAITAKGLAALAQQRKPKADNRPRKGSTAWSVPKERRQRTPKPRVIKQKSDDESVGAVAGAPKKAWEPPKPKPPPTITVPENVKVTVYQSQFTYEIYQQPKNFMECLR